MIPEDFTHKQPPASPPATTGTTCICPHYGHVHSGYAQQASTLLDCLQAAQEALREAKRLVETEVLP
jgi:hypothetical protein